MSIAPTMHLIADDVAPKRVAKISDANAVIPPWVNALVEGIADVIGHEARRRKVQVLELQRRIDELEARTRPAEIEERLAKVEQRTAEFRYVGVWQPDTNYRPGNFTTHDGSTWICKAQTSSRPGADVEAWQLTAKRGADGHDVEAARRGVRSSR